MTVSPNLNPRHSPGPTKGTMYLSMFLSRSDPPARVPLTCSWTTTCPFYHCSSALSVRPVRLFSLCAHAVLGLFLPLSIPMPSASVVNAFWCTSSVLIQTLLWCGGGFTFLWRRCGHAGSLPSASRLRESLTQLWAVVKNIML